MQFFAENLAAGGLRVIRFEFPYMRRRRLTGKKSPPDRAPVLMQAWRDIIKHFGPQNLIIGGKSMGGRIASMVAAEIRDREIMPAGLVCLGYPFHPAGKPDQLRVDHLHDLKVPTLFCQGTRDTLGHLDDVAKYTLPDTIKFCWLTDGDHSFKPRKKSGITEQTNWRTAITSIIRFVHTPSEQDPPLRQ